MTDIERNRPLTEPERVLALYMLEHGGAEARDYIAQLELAEVTPWRCPCGCASINFQLRGRAPAPPGVHVLGDYVFGAKHELSGAFIYSCDGVLSGLEVYGLAGDAPSTLPLPLSLRPFPDPASSQSRES
jgi:hypothetical protein